MTTNDSTGRRQLEALGQLIRKQRQQMELTLRDLAERANVSNPYLSQIERGLHEPSVESLIHLRTQHLGPEELLVGAKVSFRRGLTVAKLADAVDRVEGAVRTKVPEARIMYIEPDVVRKGAAADGATPS